MTRVGTKTPAFQYEAGMNKPASLTARRSVNGPDSLTLRGLLNELVRSGLINSASARAVVEPPKRKDGVAHHPLVIAAAQEWPDRRNEGRKLTMEVLTQWLARRVHLPYMRIDPLKLDVAAHHRAVIPTPTRRAAGFCR